MTTMEVPLAPAEYLSGPELYEQRNSAPYTSIRHWVIGDKYAMALEAKQAYMLEGIEEDGLDAQDSEEEADEAFSDHLEEILIEVRKEFPGFDTEHFPSEKEQLEYIRDSRADLEKKAAEHLPVAEKLKQAFVERVLFAIEHQGLPLTEAQVSERLEGVRFSIVHPATTAFHGSFDTRRNLVNINADDESIKVLPLLICHELTHVLSGTRDIKQTSEIGIDTRRTGFEQDKFELRVRNRAWLNEAFTQLFAEIMFSDNAGYKIDFASEEPLPVDALKKVVAEVNSKWEYTANMRALFKLFKGVPLKTLTHAFFLQDFDSFEADKYAGRHAERELQRRLKIVGGITRIKQLHAIDTSSTGGLAPRNNDFIDTLAAQNDRVLNSPALLRRNERILAAYQKMRQKGIDLARASLQ